MIRTLICLALLCLASGAAAARQVALVVGIQRYEKVVQLKNPLRDAAAVADRLRDQGFDVIEAFDADRFALDRARTRFLTEARGADLALFYFAGHGIQLFDRNVLLVRDADPDRADTIPALGLDLTQLMAELRAAGPVRTAFLIDACRDNPLGFEETVALLRRLQPAAGSAAAADTRGAARSRGLSVVALPTTGSGAGEVLAFFAAQPGNVSYDGDGRNSYYVEGLLEALATPNRPLTDVLRSASAYVRTVTKGAQVPQLVSDWTGDIVLGRAQTAIVRYLNTWRANGDAPLSADEVRIVGEAARPYPVLSGTFIVKEGQTFSGDLVAASDAEKARAKAIGSINGFAIDYDIDRDGRPETIGVYVRQTNVVMNVVDEGVSLLDAPCYDFDTEQISAMEIALRDINGDRRPEVFLHYQTDAGTWGNFCILEYLGSTDLADARRTARATGFAGRSLFRILLRHEGAWTVRVGADNSIETCAGSNCHTRSSYSFDGTYFRMTLDQSDAPSPAKAKPFRDNAEHLRNQGKAAGAQGQVAAAEQLAPPRPALPEPLVPVAAITRYIAEVYLPSGAGEAGSELTYEPQVSYYGKSVTRSAVLADKRRYVARWPRRAYRLDPGSVSVVPGRDGAYEATFEYTYEVSNGRRTSGGRGRTRLTLRQSEGSFAIAREDGEVIRAK
ncbi:MAG: caspase domain-containing protein [Hyphomicrobiaceae bacterium]